MCCSTEHITDAIRAHEQSQTDVQSKWHKGQQVDLVQDTADIPAGNALWETNILWKLNIYMLSKRHCQILVLTLPDLDLGQLNQ